MKDPHRPICSGWGVLWGIVCGAAALYYGRQFLLTNAVSTRIPMPASQIITTTDGVSHWPIPQPLYSKRWFRTAVRVWEEGKPLPFRVEYPEQLAAAGPGSFCAENNRLVFLATENKSSPGLAPRRFEFETIRPSYRGAVLAAIWAGASLGFFLLHRPVRERLRAWVSRLMRDQRLTHRCQFHAAVLLLGLAGVALAAGFFGPLPFYRTVTVATGEIFFSPNHLYGFYPPSWIRAYPDRMNRLALFDDRDPLPLFSGKKFEAESDAYGFFVDQRAVRFRPRDLSNPATNERTYCLRVCLITPGLALFFALLFGLSGLGLVLRLQPNCFNSAQRVVWWRIALAIIVLAKLYAIAGDDVTAAAADQFGYVTSTVHWLWGNAIATLPSHPPGFPLVAGLIAQLGIPWRLALEGLYLAACWLVAREFFRFSGSRTPALLLFALLSWHPYTFSGFREYMADPWMLVITLVLLSFMLRAFTQPVEQWKWPASLGLGLMLSLWDWSRYEGLLVVATYAWFVLLVLARWRLAGDGPRQFRLRMVGWLLLPLLLLATLHIGLNACNYWRYGVYAKSQIGAPGLMALMKALYRIRPEEKIKYAPVTRQSLRAACAASPTLQPFAEKLLDPDAMSTRLSGERITGVKGEFGPFLNWLLPQSLPADCRRSDRLMAQGAAEIEAALRAGRLPARAAHFPLDPNYDLWLPSLVNRMRTAWSTGTRLEAATHQRAGLSHQGLMTSTFDQAANRRAALANPRLFVLDGFLEAPPKSVDSMALLDAKQQMIAASVLSSNWWRSCAFGFRVPLEPTPDRIELAFLSRGIIRLTVPLELVAGQPPPFGTDRGFADGSAEPDHGPPRELPLRVTIPGTGELIQGNTSWAWVENRNISRHITSEQWLNPYYRHCVWLAIFLAAAGTWLDRKPSPQILGVLAFGALLTFGWLALRAGLYGLLDADFGWYAERYMLCISPVYVILLMGLSLLAVTLAGLLWQGLVSRCWVRHHVAGNAIPPDSGGPR